VTIVQIIRRALDSIQTLTSSIASIKAIFAGAEILDTHWVDKISLTVFVGCTGVILVVVVVGNEESFWLSGWEGTSSDAISLEIVIARANDGFLGCWRGRAGCVDMTYWWRLKTLVC
jgi:hypothetical protein